MIRTRGLVSAVVVCMAFSLFGQGRPVTPGNPAVAPDVIVDSTGATVGEVLKQESNGLARASVRYPIAGGDYVVLGVNSQSISHFASLSLVASSLQGARVFFKEADCSGDAYVAFGFGGIEQLTRRQAVVLSGIVQPPPPTQPVQSCTPLGATSWLFTTPTATCGVVALPDSPITFGAYYGPSFGGPYGLTQCSPIPGGVTLPNAMFPPGISFTIYQRSEDLLAKFRPPFHIP